MTCDTNQFGLGPERITNEWLNRLQGCVLSNRQVLKSYHAGVVWGCEPTFLVDGSTLKVKVAQGAVISDGVYFEIAGVELEVGSSPDHYVWVFVDQTGEVSVDVNPAPAPWPSDSSEIPPSVDDVEYNLAVLGFGKVVTAGDAWEWGYDIRHFVREKPNGAVLVVGDLNAGADFESIQQALDYLFACDDGDNDVPRRILVTQKQTVTEPLMVRCNGVIIEGVPNEVGAPADSEIPDERVVLTWSHGGASDPGAGALINVNNAEDVYLRNLHFLRQESDTWCAIYQPGDRFHLEGCVFGEEDTDSLMAVAIDFGPGGTEAVTAIRNRAHGLHRGLFDFTYVDQGTGEIVSTSTTGWLRRALVAHNYVSTAGLKEPDDGSDDWNECWEYCGEDIKISELPPWDEPDRYFFAIDCGVNPSYEKGAYFNSVQSNVINHCFNGIRIGNLSKARSNTIHNCILFGVVATAAGEVEAHPTAETPQEGPGASEITGNGITFGTFPSVPWWRAGIRLEMTTCYVGANTIIAGEGGCGIVHGPLVLDDVSSIKAHFAALRYGCHAVVGNNIIMNPLQGPSWTINHAAAITRKWFGVALISVENRVTDNGIFHARTGILVNAYNVVANNVIEPTVVAVFGWAHNTVGANTIGWIPHAAEGLPWRGMSGDDPTGAAAAGDDQGASSGGAQDLTHRAAAPSQGPPPVEMGQGAIMLSYGNNCTGNVIVCAGQDSASIVISVGIYVRDWPSVLFDVDWPGYFGAFWKSVDPVDNPLACKLKEKKSGGNVISSPLIHLATPRRSGYRSGSSLETFYAIGMMLHGDTENNTVTDAYVWRGLFGILVMSGSATISGCTVWANTYSSVGIIGEGASEVSGTALLTLRGPPTVIGPFSHGSSMNDCLVIQKSYSGTDLEGRPCLDVMADRVSVNDCAMLNYASHCIDWRGSRGVCGGCWFLAGDANPQGDPGLGQGQTRFAAIRFGHIDSSDSEVLEYNYFPLAGTEANLVYGAHMLNCQPLGTWNNRTTSPIEYSNRYDMYGSTPTTANPDPPAYYDGNLGGTARWTNRIAVESCYYWVNGDR